MLPRCTKNSNPVEEADKLRQMPDDRAQSFLQMIRKSQRGRWKAYLGYDPGVNVLRLNIALDQEK